MRKKIALFASLPVEAIVSGRDVDNIYKVPLYFHAEGVDDFILEHFGLEAAGAGARRVGAARCARPARRRAGRPCGSRSSASTSSSRTPTCRSSRRCATPASSTAAGIEIDWVDSETLGRRRGARRGSPEADGILIPGGFGVRGIEGKIAAARIAREQRIPYPGHLPRHADGGGRVRPPRRRDGRRELDRVRPRDALPGHRPPARAEGGRGHGRHDAPRAPTRSSCTRTRAPARSTARRSSTSATATAMRSTTSCASGWRRRGWSAPAPRRTSDSWRSSRSPTTRSSSPRSTTRSSSRGPSARRRCSATSWRRRSPGRTTQRPTGGRRRAAAAAR